MNNETLINSLAHNPRCIQAHKEISVPYTPIPPSPDPKKETTKTNDTKPQIAIAVDKPLEVVTSTATDVSSTLSSLLSGTSTTLGTTGMGIFGTQLTTSTIRNPPLPPIEISTDTPVSAVSPLSSPLWRPFGPVVNNESIMMEEMQKTADTTSTNKSDSTSAEPMVDDSERKVTFDITETTANDIASKEGKEKSLDSDKPTDPVDTKESDKSSTDDDKTDKDKKSDDKEKEESPAPYSSTYSSYMKDPCPHCGLYTHDDILGYDMLRSSFRNWPCICTTILGFNPFPCMESKTSFPALSTIQTLDNFMNNMFVNCDSGLIVGCTGTMITEMNNAFEKGVDIKPVLEADDNLEGMDETNISLYVGVRYIRSVVRTLMLEHSRVKNSVSEVQLSREGRNRTTQLQMRSKIVQQILKYVPSVYMYMYCCVEMYMYMCTIVHVYIFTHTLLHEYMYVYIYMYLLYQVLICLIRVINEV